MTSPTPLHPTRTPVLVLCQDNGGLLEVTCSSLAAAGYRDVHVLAAPMLRWARHSRAVKSYTTLPAEVEEPVLLETLALTAARTGARVLLPVNIQDVSFAARFHRCLPDALACVPVPEAGQLAQVANKTCFTALTVGMGLPVPPSLAVTPGLTVDEVEAALPYPVLAKAIASAGGCGVHRLRDRAAVAEFLAAGHPGEFLLQQELPGNDLAMTLLCEEGEVFAFNLRQRWFGQRSCGEFGPPVDWEFFECPAVEALGRRWVRELKFTGIADFDLIFDAASSRAWFLECDPRMMFSQRACAVLGMNVSDLMVRRALGERLPEVRARQGHFLSMHSMRRWVREKAWRRPRRGPLYTGLRAVAQDPLPFLCRRLGIGG